ncbi:Tn3 family transposase [Streptosporangium roseum]|uniref:Tn3 family transposase n=1 Tax=Streptosporangium roseum TaxID=2001 RepID=UPI0002D65343|nr:Tn3 family transposase [Streptosporangium roseum]
MAYARTIKTAVPHQRVILTVPADPSIGQRFPVRGKTLAGRTMVIHGGQVPSTYTHVSDQWSTYGTKIIVPAARAAHFVLDDFLGNATDLPITEHATDTHGATLINFVLFDLVGKALTPRMRDLTRVRTSKPTAPAITTDQTRS